MAKKQSAKRQAVEIELGDRKIRGYPQEFRPVKEDWSVYQLGNGATVKIRVLVESIHTTDETTPDGQPLIVVRQAPIVLYEKPKK